MIILVISLLLSAMAVHGAMPPEARFAAAYEQELRGQFADATLAYRSLLNAIGTNESPVAGHVLYRLGACELREGRPEDARRIWQALIRSLPPDHPAVQRTRDALTELERETDLIRVQARIVMAPAGASGPVAAARAWIMAGEWGSEPPVVADDGGVFRVDRRRSGQLADGRGYVLVHAEHPVERQAAVAVITGIETSTPRIVLAPALAVTARVVERGGQPVAGARIRVLALKRIDGVSRSPDKGREVPGELVPVAVDRLIPPVFSGADGGFSVDGLVPGLRYTFTADKQGYLMERPLTLDAPAYEGKQAGNVAAAVPLGAILMMPVGDIMLRGRVSDEAGQSLDATVSVWSPPPVVQSVAETNTDRDGRFAFREIRENLVTLRAETKGGAVRELAGIKPMGQEVDLVIRPDMGTAPLPPSVESRGPGGVNRGGAVVAGQSALPAGWLSSLHWLRGMAPNGDAVQDRDLTGKVVVLRFASAYLEARLMQLYPGEPLMLAQLQKEFEGRGLVCVWVLPRTDNNAGGLKLALDCGGDFPVAVDMKGDVWALFDPPPQGGYGVIDRKGVLRCLCEGEQVFKMVKGCLGE